MRIGELAQRAGLSTKALRFYEQAGVLPRPARTASGYRDYDETALARLGFVRAAQSAGLTLAEIRTIIEVREDQGRPCEHVADLLDRHVAALDQRIAEAILRRGDFGFFGLIGSRTKRQRFIHRFEQIGISPEAISRMTCPIGVPGIAGKEPERIALGVVAQLLQNVGA